MNCPLKVRKKATKNLSAAFRIYIKKIKTAYIEYKLSEQKAQASNGSLLHECSNKTIPSPT